MSRTNHQHRRVLAALRTGPATAADLWQRHGVMRAAARVHELRALGHDIRSREIVVRNRDGGTSRVAQYSLGDSQMALLPQHPGRGQMTEQAVRA